MGRKRKKRTILCETRPMAGLYLQSTSGEADYMVGPTGTENKIVTCCVGFVSGPNKIMECNPESVV